MAETFEGRAVVLNIEIEKGQTFRLPLRRRLKATGVAIDLTGYTAVMQIRTKAGTVGSPLLELLSSASPPDPRVELGGVAGTVTAIIEDETTATLTFKTAVYDLVLEDTTGDKIRLCEGKVKVIDGVTI